MSSNTHTQTHTRRWTERGWHRFPLVGLLFFFREERWSRGSKSTMQDLGEPNGWRRPLKSGFRLYRVLCRIFRSRDRRKSLVMICIQICRNVQIIKLSRALSHISFLATKIRPKSCLLPGLERRHEKNVHSLAAPVVHNGTVLCLFLCFVSQ